MKLLLVILITGICVAIVDWICLCIGLIKVKDVTKGDEIEWEL